MMPVQRALEYYVQLQKETELDKLVNDKDDQQHMKKKDQRPENTEQAHKFRVHKMTKSVSPLGLQKQSLD